MKLIPFALTVKVKSIARLGRSLWIIPALILFGCQASPRSDSSKTANSESADPQSSNKAEALFRKMERAFRRPKTLKFKYLGVWKEERAEGEVILAEQERFLCRMRIRGSGDRILVRDYGSDGRTLRLYYKGGSDTRKPVPKGVRENVGSVFLYTLPSFIDPWMFVEDGIPIANQGTLSDFRFLRTTRLNGHECHEIEYVRRPLMLPGKSRTKYRVRLWVDVSTDCPVRRVTSRIGDDSGVPYVETFDSFQLNEDLAPKLFMLPAKK